MAVFAALGEVPLGLENEKPNFENPNLTFDGFIAAEPGAVADGAMGAWFSSEAGSCCGSTSTVGVEAFTTWRGEPGFLGVRDCDGESFF
jgi:hypothetical protein